MSCLPLNVDAALGMLTSPAGTVQAYETTGTAQANGTWAATPGATRTIQAVVLAMKPYELELLAPGSAGSGGIVVQTTETLYFSDAQNAGVQNQQSFVIYQGLTWRVVANGLVSLNAGFNLYQCVRYFPNGTDTSTAA